MGTLIKVPLILGDPHIRMQCFTYRFTAVRVLSEEHRAVSTVCSLTVEGYWHRVCNKNDVQVANVFPAYRWLVGNEAMHDLG